jgi:hypothetical protein
VSTSAPKDDQVHAAYAGESRDPARQQLTGAAIGGTFGLVYVLANASTPLGRAAGIAFRVVAILGFVLLLASRRRLLIQRGTSGASPPGERAGLFGRRYWLIVAAEAAALALGFVVFLMVGAPPQIYLPWTTLVVGVHFIAFWLAGVWGGSITRIASVLILLGIAGLLLTATPAIGWVPFVAGVLSGFTLLGGSLSSAARRVALPQPREQMP